MSHQQQVSNTPKLPQIEPDPLPPDIKVIECPASVAEYRSSDNSKWTNILKEPFHIQKGSEIRVSTNFIDQRGIDPDIIQFTSSGNQQDNSHTLLSQVYTTNDGYNGKTTSYDYMSRETVPLILIDPGQDVGGAGTALSFTTVTGGGTGLIATVAIGAYCIRPSNISITASGSGYTNGALFTIASGGDPMSGYIITNDTGGIAKLVFTKPYSANNPPDPNAITVTDNILGSGATFSNTVTQNGYYFSALSGSRTDVTRGTGYERGDLVTIEQNSVPSAIPAANRPVFKVGQIYSGKGQVNDEALFDQGYNYEKVPLLRWASVYDVNQNFSYGNNLGNRSFTTGFGKTISISTPSDHQSFDTCISSATMILPREDEFAPGIFHKEFDSLVDDTNDTQAQIALFSPIANFKTTAQDGGTFTWGWDNIGPTITVNHYDYVQNDIIVKGNVLNAYPIGCTLRIEFIDPNTPSLANRADLDDQWNNIVSGCYIVKSLTQGSTSSTMSLSPFTKSSYVGSGTDFGLYATATIYPPSATTTVQLVYSNDSDNLGAPTRAPEIKITTDGTGAITGIITNTGDLDLGEGNRPGMVYTIQGYASTDRIMCLKIDDTLGWYGARGIRTFTNTDLTYNSGGTRDMDMFIIPTNNYILTGDVPFEEGDRRGFRYIGSAATLGNNLPATIANQGINSNLPDDDTIGVTSYISNGLYRNSGQSDSTLSTFTPSLGTLINHSESTKLLPRSLSDDLQEISISYGVGGMMRPADAGTSTFLNTSNNYVLVINIALWDAAYGTNTIPVNTTLEIVGTIGGVEQEATRVQMETGGLESQDGTNYYILIKTPDVHNNFQTYFPIESSLQASFGGSKYFIPKITTTVQNYEGSAIDGVNMWYTIPLYYNNQIKFNWINSDTTDYNEGAIVSTGPQNYFGSSDINTPTLISNGNAIESVVSSSVKSTYDNGGMYFLTRFTGHLTNPTNTNTYQYDNSGINEFNNWGVFLPFAQLPPNMYSWRNGKANPISGETLSYTESNDNYNSSTAYTDASNFWAYQPLYKQKTLTIDKNFCVASDISGIWTRSAHALTGAIDMTSGLEYTPANQNPLLQNEFIFPVYGSNNIIGPDGTYVIDTDIYPYTGGLEAGHCVGKAYLTDDNQWLAGPLISQLPSDSNASRDFQFYYVFFRTPFTFIRGYDPLANNSGAPDFTPLTTVNQTADKIGNANDSKATPPVAGRTALDGTTMLDAGDTPVPTGYELGSAGGDASAVRFGTQQYYPIYYLDERNKSLAPKAKASQYVGSQNLTLAFATNISTFTFQYFHTPYTSPFVDGQGGSESIRVFYGNRKRGIFNHETLGGINITNYCRPEYPRGIFTYREVNSSSNSITQYPNGLNPLTSVAEVGQRFLNKVGFIDADVGISNSRVDSSLAKTGFSYTATEIDITSRMDTGAPDTVYWAYTTTFNATTGSDIDSSDSILAEVPAPEASAGLESNNTKITPNIGANNYILRKWGDVIFYPYSLNSSSNSFQDKAIVRFDNASSTYGSIGGLLLSNSNRGMGLPNTVGSTFNTDDDTIPRTLNPDCELYLAYTIATQSNFIQATLLPAKLPNGYIMVLSSLQKQTPVYMSEAGWVNALSVVNKTFLTGDFILSEGQLSFYTQEDMIISEITSELRDTNFNSPTVLGPNSTIVYQITNYNPQPPKPLPTIEEEQEQDYAIMAMIQEHLDFLEGHTKSSPLSELEGNLRQAGLSILQGGSSMSDVIQAMKNQIEFHDLPNLSQGELSQFLSTPEGKDMQANIADMAVINQQVGQMAQNREDIALEQASQAPGARAVEHLERQNEQAIREIKRRTEEIRKRIPQNFFTPSLPPEQQMEPLPSNETLTIRQLRTDIFLTESEKRHSLYLTYKDNRIAEGRPPLTYEEFQHFHYGDILDVRNPTQRNIIRMQDPDLLPDIKTIEPPTFEEAIFTKDNPNIKTEFPFRRRPQDPSEFNEPPIYVEEGAPAQDILESNRPRTFKYQIDKKSRIEKLQEPEAINELIDLKNNPMAGYAAAYESLPDYMRPRHNEPGYFENIRKFQQEVESGTAELTGAQIDILRESGIPYQPSVAVKAAQGRDIPIPEDLPGKSFAPSRHYLSTADLPELKHLPDLANRPFRSKEDRETVKNLIETKYRTKIAELGSSRKDKTALQKEINKEIAREGITHRQPSEPLPEKVKPYRKSKQVPVDPEYTGYRDPNVRKTGYNLAQQEKKVRDEAIGRIKEHQKRMRPTGQQVEQNRNDLHTVRKQREIDKARTYMQEKLASER